MSNVTHADKKASAKLSKSASKTPRGDQAAVGPATGKVFPPQGPVIVPTPPAKPDASTPDEAAKQSTAPLDESSEANWSDTTKPMPYAKKARSSLL
jgi:hypothetical protein